jgi:hypothetical protein
MTYSTRELRANGVDGEVLEIRAWRRKHQIRASTFAALVGVDRAHWGDIEVGRAPMGRKVRERVLAFMVKARGSEPL